MKTEQSQQNPPKNPFRGKRGTAWTFFIMSAKNGISASAENRKLMWKHKAKGEDVLLRRGVPSTPSLSIQDCQTRPFCRGLFRLVNCLLLSESGAQRFRTLVYEAGRSKRCASGNHIRLLKCGHDEQPRTYVAPKRKPKRARKSSFLKCQQSRMQWNR